MKVKVRNGRAGRDSDDGAVGDVELMITRKKDKEQEKRRDEVEETTLMRKVELECEEKVQERDENEEDEKKGNKSKEEIL